MIKSHPRSRHLNSNKNINNCKRDVMSIQAREQTLLLSSREGVMGVTEDILTAKTRRGGVHPRKQKTHHMPQVGAKWLSEGEL